MAKDMSLNWRLTLEERQRVADNAGGYSESWISLGVLWGHVQARSVSATEVTAGSTSLVRYRVTVRGVPDGHPQRPQVGQRFRSGSKVYTIDSVSESDETARYLMCQAREEVLA